ncbi:LacI family transcriptional regulator [Rhizobium sp. P38BS-XIX]|nr:LacI family DNA-binding transcriptional regulator [Rhizobium sp. P38BS-XIX]NLS01731.1 LacI family transcriptional regulator [Rhizobium sp. P38BS-XIX]
MDNRIAKVGSVDVAKLAGVSRSAVSRTFTEGAYVSAETRQKVLRAAEMLGYRPNILARSLTTNRTHILGIITTDLINPFYALLLQECIERIQDKGLAAFVLRAAETDNDELISRLLSYQVDGVILANTKLASRTALDLANSGKPVVTINRYVDLDEITSVTCDNEEAGAQVADHLIAIGRKRIAFIAGDPDTSSSRDRERGFKQRLAEHGLKVQRESIGFYTHDGGAAAARMLLSPGTKPDAIFAANDLMGFAALDVAKLEFGLRVPDDIAIIGFDNAMAADWPAYRLSSVDQNIPRMVDVAIEEILSRLSGERSRTRHFRIATNLVARESTGATKMKD